MAQTSKVGKEFSKLGILVAFFSFTIESGHRFQLLLFTKDSLYFLVFLSGKITIFSHKKGDSEGEKGVSYSYSATLCMSTQM